MATTSNQYEADKMVGSIVELRTTMQHCLAAIGIGVPLMIVLLSFLVVQSFSTSAKVDRLGDRLERVERERVAKL